MLSEKLYLLGHGKLRYNAALGTVTIDAVGGMSATVNSSQLFNIYFNSDSVVPMDKVHIQATPAEVFVGDYFVQHEDVNSMSLQLKDPPVGDVVFYIQITYTA